MRIAVIAPPWVAIPPPAYGGTEAVIDQLCRGLVAAGHDVVLFATGDSTCPVPTNWVYDDAQGDNIGNAAIELRHVLYAYDNLGSVDVVHDHTLMGPVLAASRRQLPVVTTNHGTFNEELASIYRAVAGKVPIIAISARQAEDAGDTPIARVIHHGVDVEQFPVGTGAGAHLLFLGRMAPSKGVHLAARAAREAGVPLLIGAKMREAPEHAYFEAEVRPLLGTDVEYLGELTFDEKVELLGTARALLNPIRWEEPFGMVMIESLACGTPVLTFPKGAAPEIVDHGVTGFLAKSWTELVASIDKVDALDRAACRAAVVERFSTARMASDHVALFEETIAEVALRDVFTTA